jgi:photosystem I subunit 8
MVTDLTQLTGDYAASWLPWLMIPLIFYILPFPIFALAFLWIEQEASPNGSESVMASSSGEGVITMSSNVESSPPTVVSSEGEQAVPDQ